MELTDRQISAKHKTGLSGPPPKLSYPGSFLGDGGTLTGMIPALNKGRR